MANSTLPPSVNAVGRFAYALFVTGVFAWAAAIVCFAHFADPAAGVASLGVAAASFGGTLHMILR